MTATALWSQHDVDAERARRDMRLFVREAWPIIEPSTPFSDNWHVGVLCEHLSAVTNGEIKKLLVNIPPGTSKSLLTCVFWPAWEMATDPALRYLCGSFDEGLTIRDNSRTRDLVESAWFQERWPHVQMRPGQNQKIRRETTAGGWRIATSVGGRGTGEHPDRIIVDDPHNPKKAESEAERQAALDWFDRTLSTRGASRGARFVVIMQRLHQKDLSGHILARADAEDWVHISLPMRYEPPAMLIPSAAQRPRVDPRSEPGQLLWPELYPDNVITGIEKSLGSYGAAGQLQQRPVPLGGGMFKREHLEIVEAAPGGLQCCRFWDCAGTEGAGDYTAGVKVGRSEDGIYYVLNVIRGRWSAHKVDLLVQQMAQLDGVECRIREEQEPGSAGKAVIAARTRALAGYNYRGVPATGEKSTRWQPLAIQAEATNVKIVRDKWNAEFIEELCAAPFGEHDDQCDAGAGAFNELALGQREVIAAVTVDTSWQKGHFR
jgi:predicted phage terminase large subunit-like protein